MGEKVTSQRTLSPKVRNGKRRERRVGTGTQNEEVHAQMKLLLIGFDALSPQLLFPWRDELPAIDALCRGAV